MDRWEKVEQEGGVRDKVQRSKGKGGQARGNGGKGDKGGKWCKGKWGKGERQGVMGKGDRKLAASVRVCRSQRLSSAFD